MSKDKYLLLFLLYSFDLIVWTNRSQRKKTKAKAKTTMRKRRTKKSIKNSWLVLLIVWDNHGRKMLLIHKVSLYNQYWSYGFPDFMSNLLAIQSNTRPRCPKYALFSQPQLSQVVLSCFFFQIVNPSVTSWLGGIFVILRASNKHTLLFWPFPCTKTSPEVHFFLSKTRSQDSTSCTAFQCGRDSEATRRSCYAHHSTWKLRKQTQKLASVRNALFNHFCIFIQQINTASASVSFSQTRSIQIRGKFNS